MWTELDSIGKEWGIRKGLLITPNKWSLTPERIITGDAFIEIGAEQDRKNMSQIIKVARFIIQ